MGTTVANLRARIFGRIAVAHVVGLWTVGMYGTIGTTAGFSVLGGALGLFLGGVLSIPWLVALAAIVWFCAPKLDRHPIIFVLIGPLLVCGSWWVLSGAQLLEVTISSAVSSAVYLGLAMWTRVKRIPQAGTTA